MARPHFSHKARIVAVVSILAVVALVHLWFSPFVLIYSCCFGFFPAIGASKWAGRSSRPFWPAVMGGAKWGAIQGAIIATFPVIMGMIASPMKAPDFIKAFGLALALSFIVGSMTGLLVGVCLTILRLRADVDRGVAGSLSEPERAESIGSQLTEAPEQPVNRQEDRGFAPRNNAQERS